MLQDPHCHHPERAKADLVNLEVTNCIILVGSKVTLAYISNRVSV